MKFMCTNIKWDTDGQSVELPSTVVVDIDGEPGDDLQQVIGDKLSDQVGFCHFSFDYVPMDPKFQAGQIVTTPAAILAFAHTGQQPLSFLRRHLMGDWGDVGNPDAKANQDALKTGARLFSVYHLSDHTKIWIITEAVNDEGNRASTCILLPEDY